MKNDFDNNQKKIDYWNARKAFCETCPDRQLCLLSIEGGGDTVVDCSKLNNFIKTLNKYYGY